MNRREFSRLTGMGVLAVHAVPPFAAPRLMQQPTEESRNIPLGIGNHSLRAMKPNAAELIDFATKHRLDSVQFNTFAPFENLETKHLERLKEQAVANGISLYVGVGSISEQSVKFSDRYGDADTLVREGLRVARLLGSPIIGVRIGLLDDRYTGGGIRPKMEEVSRRMKSFGGAVKDAGIKFAFENHAGDMRSEELLELIEMTGEDICGAFFDPGNAIYAMEDPAVALETVGQHIICCQARDVVIWPSEEGATFQWTAAGEGMMDFNHYTRYLSTHCPGVPIHIETISNSPRQIPFLNKEYWDGFPELKATGIIDFLKLVREGHPIEVAQAPPGADKKAFDMENQVNDLLKSTTYLRDVYGVGLKR